MNIRPYKYVYSQKKFMEKLLDEMLKSKVIRPIINSFVSPMVLIQKNDGSWMFYMYSRSQIPWP